MDSFLPILYSCCFALVAFIATWVIYAIILNIALRYNIVDQPNERKLQHRPIPVLGGLTVFFGIAVSVCGAILIMGYSDLLPFFAAMVIMLVVGVGDDIYDLSPLFRFIIEIAVSLYFIYVCGLTTNDFHSLWGFHIIPNWAAIPLTIVSVVGIINAINLIDGVDGYSSGYCAMSSILFSVIFIMSDYYSMAVLALVTAGAAISFFLHNVFGKLSKMFIGDGGALMLGVIMVVFVLNILKDNSPCETLALDNMGLIPCTLATLAIPVFDTIRVMVTRMIKLRSPFHPDKIHLHHLFIEAGFSHIGTTISILIINLFVWLIWFAAYLLGASINMQLYIVLALGFGMTFVFYHYMNSQRKKDSRIYQIFKRIGNKTHIERKNFWQTMRDITDREVKHHVQE